MPHSGSFCVYCQLLVGWRLKEIRWLQVDQLAHVAFSQLHMAAGRSSEKKRRESTQCCGDPDSELTWCHFHHILRIKVVLKIDTIPGRLGGSVVKRLPSAQVMIPESWDRAPHQAPCSAGGLLLLLPLPLLVFPLSELCQCRPGEGNCSCCKECMLCLGTLWDECCDCVGMCNPRNYSDTPPTSKSTVEELHEPIPSLFRALTEGDTQLNWNIVSFPVAEELSHHENLVSFLETVNQPHHQNVSVPSNNVHAPYSSDKEHMCTVVYFDDCMSIHQCKISCESMGASKYRWFHNACFLANRSSINPEMSLRQERDRGKGRKMKDEVKVSSLNINRIFKIRPLAT
ncbi:twisted gastrulation protein homolog 1 isoform X2 [Halichoerus grypus]